MAERRRFTLAWFLALVALLLATVGAMMYWDVRDVVFWGVMALWFQQMALHNG